MIVPNTYEFFLFGKPIFQGYYVTFNMDSSTVSFMPQFDSDKPLFAPQSLPTPSYAKEDKPGIAKKSIPLVFLVISVAVF